MLRPVKMLSVIYVVMMIVLSGCGSLPTQAAQDLQPVYCHRETFVGILYIMVKNDGTDAGTSNLRISYKSGTKKNIPVSISLNLPFIPAHSQRLVMVNLPTATLGATDATDSTHFRNPSSRVTMQFSNKSVGTGQKESIFFSDCTNS